MKKRSKSGQALLEGVSALVVIAIASGLAMLFLLDTAASAYYRVKLALISTQCAKYAANQSGSLTDTKQYAVSLMAANNVGSGNPGVKVASAQIGGQNGCTVTISDNFSLFGKVFGPRISLSDTACAITPVLGNSELVLRYNQSISPKLTEVVLIPGEITQLPPAAAPITKPRYTLNGDAGWMNMPQYGLSKP